MDAIGVMIERISGMDLEDYFQKYIFEPAGIEHLSFYLNDAMQETLAGMHMRSAQHPYPIG